ncbi:GAF domain-containing protein [Salipiger abyssi]|uniref:GAF domain-containing protein n=1 Tax=Salipiger abyssi TaxID=1250539 RepID=UPI00405932E7
MPARDFTTLLRDMSELTEIRAVTALRYLDGGAERIFSSHPQVFAATGFKRFSDAPTMARVHETKAPVVSDGAEAIHAGFSDGQRILDLGADAIANLPVRRGDGRVVGQLNVMGRVGAFPPSVLGGLQTLADAYSACFETAGHEEGAQCD